MKRFVVAHVDFFDNLLIQEIVEADTEQDARWMHSKIGPNSGWANDLNEFREETNGMNADEFQEWCFNSDMLVNVMEV